MTSDPTPSPTPAEIEARLEKNRADLAATIDELSERLNPKVRAAETVTQAKQVLHDAGTDPSTSQPDRDRARKIVGIGALGVAGFVALVTAIARRR